MFVGAADFNSCSRGIAPTPNKFILDIWKKMKNVLIIMTDQYLTSGRCLICSGFVVGWVIGEGELPHGVRYCPKCQIFWFRDRNSSMSMVKVGLYQLQYGERPAGYFNTSIIRC